MSFAPGKIQLGGKSLQKCIYTVASPVSYTHLRAHETGRNLVCRLLGWYNIYTFLEALAPWRHYIWCKIHFTSKSYVLLYWQHYYTCTAVQQRAPGKLCGVVQGMELRNFSRGCHLYSAGRPSRWASAHGPHSSFNCYELYFVLTLAITTLAANMTSQCNQLCCQYSQKQIQILACTCSLNSLHYTQTTLHCTDVQLHLCTRQCRKSGPFALPGKLP